MDNSKNNSNNKIIIIVMVFIMNIMKYTDVSCICNNKKLSSLILTRILNII